MSRMVGLGRRAVTVVCVATVLLAVGLGLAQAAGFVRLLEVQGGSMEPTIANGSLLVTTPERVGDVAVGDVVSLVRNTGVRVTHRVVDVDAATGAITTRGDANAVSDPEPYSGQSLDRVVVAVPKLGASLRYLRLFMHSPYFLALVAGGIVAAAPWERRRPDGLQPEVVRT